MGKELINLIVVGDMNHAKVFKCLKSNLSKKYYPFSSYRVSIILHMIWWRNIPNALSHEFGIIGIDKIKPILSEWANLNKQLSIVGNQQKIKEKGEAKTLNGIFDKLAYDVRWTQIKNPPFSSATNFS